MTATERKNLKDFGRAIALVINEIADVLIENDWDAVTATELASSIAPEVVKGLATPR